MDDRQWITERYGPISFRDTGIFIIAMVPLWGGVAVGLGGTVDAALADLREDIKSDGVPKSKRVKL